MFALLLDEHSKTSYTDRVRRFCVMLLLLQIESGSAVTACCRWFAICDVVVAKTLSDELDAMDAIGTSREQRNICELIWEAKNARSHKEIKRLRRGLAVQQESITFRIAMNVLGCRTENAQHTTRPLQEAVSLSLAV